MDTRKVTGVIELQIPDDRIMQFQGSSFGLSLKPNPTCLSGIDGWFQGSTTLCREPGQVLWNLRGTLYLTGKVNQRVPINQKVQSSAAIRVQV